MILVMIYHRRRQPTARGTIFNGTLSELKYSRDRRDRTPLYALSWETQQTEPRQSSTQAT
jgi:hypothetical protein